MSVNFHSLSRTQSPQPQGTDHSVTTTPPKTTAPVIAKADGYPISKQVGVIKALNKALPELNITADNLISKAGVQTLLGKASRNSNIKDAFVRFGYLLQNRLAPDASVGTNFKSAMRLAEKYQDLRANGGSNEDKLKTLLQLKEKLNAHEFPEASKKRLNKLLEFVDLEIDRQPGTHLEKAVTLKDEYDQLPKLGVTPSERFTKLEAIKEHLDAAEMGGLTDPRLQELKTSLDQELSVVMPKYEMDKEIALKASPGQLKPTRTVVRDNEVSDMRASHEHDKFVNKIISDPSFNTRMDLADEIESFDRSKLKHVAPEEIHDTTGGELRRAKLDHEVSSLIDDMAVSTSTPKLTPPSVHKEPSLETLTTKTLNDDAFHDMGARLDEALKSGDKVALKNLATQLGNLMGSDLRTAPRDVQLSFASSSGDALKNDLMHLLASQIPKGGDLRGNYSQASPELRAFLDEAYNHAATQLSDHQVDENSVVIAGETYTKQRRLGSGGFGHVDLYENSAGKQIVLKTPIMMSKPDSEEHVTELRAKFKEASVEAQAHRDAMGAGHPNVVQLEGLVRTPDGSLLIAMELAPHGDAQELIGKLDKAMKEGLISPFAANAVRITILKDMIDGMAHVSDVRNMNHYDIKPPNYFVGTGGQVKIGDFGTAKSGSEHDISKTPVDNPMWLAPEVVIARNKRSASPELAQIDAHFAKLERTELDAIDKNQSLSPDEQDTAKNVVKESIAQRKKEAEEQLTFEVTRKADVWSLGISAHQLFVGGYPFDTSFMFKYEQGLTDFVEAGELLHGRGLDKDGNETGVGVSSFDRVINQMLHPDPTKRPSFSALAQHSLFMEPGVGEKETRDLIKALTDPTFDSAKIKQASDALGV